MLLLAQLLLPLHQGVHAVVAAADLLVVLLLQHGRDAAQTADAAPPGAHATAADPCWQRLGVTGRTSMDTQSFSGPVDQLLCQIKKPQKITK